MRKINKIFWLLIGLALLGGTGKRSEELQRWWELKGMMPLRRSPRRNHRRARHN